MYNFNLIFMKNNWYIKTNKLSILFINDKDILHKIHNLLSTMYIECSLMWRCVTWL